MTAEEFFYIILFYSGFTLRVYINIKLYRRDGQGLLNKISTFTIIFVTLIFAIPMALHILYYDVGYAVNVVIHWFMFIPLLLLFLDFCCSIVQVVRAFRSKTNLVFKLLRIVSLLLLYAVFFAALHGSFSAAGK